jgi:hypothetical protein
MPCFRATFIPGVARGVIESFFVHDDGTTTVWVNFAIHGPKAAKWDRSYERRTNFWSLGRRRQPLASDFQLATSSQLSASSGSPHPSLTTTVGFPFLLHDHWTQSKIPVLSRPPLSRPRNAPCPSVHRVLPLPGQCGRRSLSASSAGRRAQPKKTR